MSLASLVINLVARTDNLEKGFGRANNEITKLQRTARMFGGDIGRVIGSAGKIGGIASAFYLVNRSMQEVAANSDKFKGLLSSNEINIIKDYASWWEKVKNESTAFFASVGAFAIKGFNPYAGIYSGMPEINWDKIKNNRAKMEQAAGTAMGAVDPAYAAKQQLDAQIKLFEFMRRADKFGPGEFEMWVAKAKAKFENTINPADKSKVNNEELEFAREYASTMERVNALRQNIVDQMKLDAGMSREMLTIEKEQAKIEEMRPSAYRDELLNRLRVTAEIQKQYDLDNKKAKEEKKTKDVMDELRISPNNERFQQFDPTLLSVSGMKIGGGDNLSVQRKMAGHLENIDRKTQTEQPTL